MDHIKKLLRPTKDKLVADSVTEWRIVFNHPNTYATLASFERAVEKLCPTRKVEGYEKISTIMLIFT